MTMVRVRKITLPDGSEPFFVDGRIVMTALPKFITLNQADPILAIGSDLQSNVPRQFSVTFVARIYEDTYSEFRAFFDRFDTAMGMRNRRFYLYDDRFWLVRHEGTRYTFPATGIRTHYSSIETYVRILNPFLFDDDLVKYRCW